MRHRRNIFLLIPSLSLVHFSFFELTVLVFVIAAAADAIFLEDNNLLFLFFIHFYNKKFNQKDNKFSQKIINHKYSKYAYLFNQLKLARIIL